MNGQARLKVPARLGALIVLSCCFMVSAMIRAGEVVAALPGALDDGFGNPIAPQKSENRDQVADSDPDAKRAPDALLAELREQRARLDERAANLLSREQTLKALEVHMRSRLDELKAARAKLAETANLVQDAAGKDVRRLAEMYQQMKPKQAGQIFNEMAPSFAAGFMAEMRADAAALIMANMDTDKAYAVSLMLAGRNMDLSGERKSTGRRLPAK